MQDLALSAFICFVDDQLNIEQIIVGNDRISTIKSVFVGLSKETIFQ